MTIDWLTVVAQALNFLVLVWLLKRFLYDRVMRAMDRREAAIAERIRAADARMEEAEQEARRHREAREGMEAQRERQLRRARDEADDLRRSLEEEVRRELDEARARWRAELEREQAVFLQDVRRQVATHFEAVARRALAELADAELEAQMARVLIERLGHLDANLKEALAARASEEPLLVRSAFEVPVAVRRALTAAIHDVFGKDVSVTYELADDLACGLELRAGGRSLAWSLDGYLDALERRLAEALARIAAGGRGDAHP